MPIRPQNRWLYTIDWRELSGSIRLERATVRGADTAPPNVRAASLRPFELHHEHLGIVAVEAAVLDIDEAPDEVRRHAGR